MNISIDDAYSLEHEYDWSYVENEGNFAIRYDFRGEHSMWIHMTGSAEGHAPKSMKPLIEALGIDTKHLTYV